MSNFDDSRQEHPSTYLEDVYRSSLQEHRLESAKRAQTDSHLPWSSRRHFFGAAGLGIAAMGATMFFQPRSQTAYAATSHTLHPSLARIMETTSTDGTYNVKDYGAVGNGTTDDTSAILAAISAAVAAGGGDVLLPGGATYLISSPLALSSFGVRLIGTGGSILQPSGSFSGAQVLLLSADFCGVHDIMIAFANTTTSRNPATNGIQITGARSCVLENVVLNYINGWAVQSTSTSSVANYWTNLNNVHTFQCNQGIHLLGNAASGYNVGHYFVNCNADQCLSGDGFLFEDAHDVLCSNLYGTVTAGPGAVLHIKGASAAVYAINVDLGASPGPSTGPTVLIESGANGIPKQIELSGILEGGASGATISAGTLINFHNVDFFNNGTYGLNITGGDGILVQECSFSANGSTGSSGRYDFQASTTGHVAVTNGIFTTPRGNSAGETNNAVNVTDGMVVFQNTIFLGAGYGSANIFNGYPSIVRNCPGYNPLGMITAPTIGPSPYTAPTKSSDMTVFLAGGTVSSVAIGGAATGLTSGTFRVPAQQTITVTYSSRPIWAWFGD